MTDGAKEIVVGVLAWVGAVALVTGAFVAGGVCGVHFQQDEAVQMGHARYDGTNFAWNAIAATDSQRSDGMSYFRIENDNTLGHTVVTRWGWGYNVANVPTEINNGREGVKHGIEAVTKEETR